VTFLAGFPQDNSGLRLTHYPVVVTSAATPLTGMSCGTPKGDERELSQVEWCHAWILAYNLLSRAAATYSA
jgi:hypothetical protein